MKKFLLINILILSVLFAFAQEVNDSDTTIYTAVEERAQFEGGDKAMMKWLNENINFLNTTSDRIQSKVFVNFVVEKDGSITNVKLLREAHTAFNNEAIRLVNSMPKWLPAKKDGKVVRSYFTLPIQIHLK